MYVTPQVIQGDGVGHEVTRCLLGDISLETGIQHVLNTDYSELKSNPTLRDQEGLHWFDLTPSLTYLEYLCQLYLIGVPISWEKFYAESDGRRIPLPTYPFKVNKFFELNFNLEKVDE